MATKYINPDHIKVHYAPGHSVKAVCGVIKYSRRVIVNLFGNWDGVIITDDLTRVTCKRCLKCRETRLHKLIALEKSCPGLMDHGVLCGEEWLLTHASDITNQDIKAQKLEMPTEKGLLTITNDFKYINDIRLIFKNVNKQ